MKPASIAQIDVSPDSCKLVFSGPLDESFNLLPTNFVNKQQVEIDFKDVDWVNSIGVKRLMAWLAGVESGSAATNFLFVNVTPAVLKQLALVNHFIPAKTKFKEVHLPYFCDNCSEDEVHVIAIPEVTGDAAKAKLRDQFKIPVKCSKCGDVLQLDISQEKCIAVLVRS